jgi:hypothetical protein
MSFEEAIMQSTEIKLFGKKVFFLYPDDEIFREIIKEMIKNGYEIYTLDDHNKALKILKKFPNCILYINIDKALKKDEWELYIKDITRDPRTRFVRLGVFTYDYDAELEKKYLDTYQLPCGVINLKAGLKKAIDLILMVLEYNEAKGQRKFVRARCNDRQTASFTVQYENKEYSGIIFDISLAGMACVFDEKTEFVMSTIFPFIELDLHGVAVNLKGQLVGQRDSATPVFIIMFDKETSPVMMDRIYDFLYYRLNSDIKSTIEE